MRERHNLDVVWVFAVHEPKGKVTERYPANGFMRTNPAHCFTDGRMSGDQIDRSLNVGPQPISQADGFILVPTNVVSKLIFGCPVRSYR
jgi:hypothetical protein